jgi:WD40 repeat protein
VLKGHSKQVLTARFSPDGNQLVSASWDKLVKIVGCDDESGKNDV